MTRWRMPPDSRCGYFFITDRVSGSPTFLRRDNALSRASSFPSPMWARMLSVIWLPMVNTGFREVRGSWNIMVSRSPLTPSNSRSVMESKSLPSNRTRPAVTLPPFPKSPMTDRAVTLLPQPDSPTIQTISPESTWNPTWSTLIFFPPSPENSTSRFVTSRICDILFPHFLILMAHFP